MKKPAIFLDRDGVLNKPVPAPGYVLRVEDFELMPGAAEATGALKEAGYFLSLATNQRCVGVGLLAADDLAAIHAKMNELLVAGGGAALDAMYYSPDERNVGSPTRKPAPGMLLESAEENGLDLSRSWMIGDSAKDVQAGLAAGVRPILIENPGSAYSRGELSDEERAQTHIVSTITEAVVIILKAGT